MRLTVRKLRLISSSLALLLMVITPTAIAGSADVGIEPAYPEPNNSRTDSIFVMTLKPGEEGKNGIRLINGGAERRNVEVYAVDSSSSVDGSFSCRQRAEKKTEVGNWVKLAKSQITLEPGTQEVIDFTVAVPKGAGPGEHDGCIMMQDQTNLPAKTGEGILLGFRSGIRLSIRVPGNIIKKLDIERVEVKRVEDGNYSVSAVARNGGNVSLDVTARAQIVSIFGQQSDVKSDAQYPIMQGATVGWPYVFERPYWGGIYKARTSLAYNSDPNDGLGEHASDQKRIGKESSWFIAIPDPVAGLVELAGLLVGVWLIGTPIRRRLKRKRIVKKWERYTVQEGDTLMNLATARGVKWSKIAKINHIKAPYLLETGSVMIVPRPAATKSVRQKKHKKSELDWFVDDTTQATSTVEKMNPPVARPHTAPPEVQLVEEMRVVRETVQKPVSAQSWVGPRESIYEHNDYDEDGELLPDWREGADESEIDQLERLDGTAHIPKMRAEMQKPDKVITKKSTSAKTKKKSSKKGK